MAFEQAQAISMLFPEDLGSYDWFGILAQLLGELPGSQVSPGKVTLKAAYPPGALPVIELVEASVAYPQLVFEVDQPLDLSIGNFKITNRPVNTPSFSQPEVFDTIERVEGDNGAYLRLHHTKTDFKDVLTLEQFYERLSGHLARVDHLGVNLPSNRISRENWHDLLSKLANQTNLYRYPDNFEWPFVIPATRAEFDNDITSFEAGREPRFELVYDDYANYPLYQFALETDLVQVELERLFPRPYGYAIPGLDHIFRSVYIFHPWPGFGIRFDLYYRTDSKTPGDWETGEWLVKAGGRIVNPFRP